MEEDIELIASIDYYLRQSKHESDKYKVMEIIEKYTSHINITPTVANLFNLDYDPRLYMGEDVLSNDYESLVVYADGSWKNEYLYYNAKNGSVINYQENDYTTEKIIEMNKTISSKMMMSSSIIKNNYFKYLKESISIEQEKIDNQLASKEEE